MTTKKIMVDLTLSGEFTSSNHFLDTDADGHIYQLDISF